MLGIFLPIISISLYYLFNNKIIDKKDIDQITSIPLIGKIMHNDSGYNLVNINSPKSAMQNHLDQSERIFSIWRLDKKRKLFVLHLALVVKENFLLL